MGLGVDAGGCTVWARGKHGWGAARTLTVVLVTTVWSPGKKISHLADLDLLA